MYLHTSHTVISPGRMGSPKGVILRRPTTKKPEPKVVTHHIFITKPPAFVDMVASCTRDRVVSTSPTDFGIKFRDYCVWLVASIVFNVVVVRIPPKITKPESTTRIPPTIALFQAKAVCIASAIEFD